MPELPEVETTRRGIATVMPGRVLRRLIVHESRLLALAGSDKSRILQATIWLADMADFQAMNPVWEAWIDPANPPTRATGEARLAAPGLKFEVIIVAAI